MRNPVGYTAAPPRPTVCLLPPQVGALLSNLTMPPKGPLHMPTPRLPTHCSHTCAPCKRGAGPQISKLLSETQPSRGLRAGGWPPSRSRALSPSTRVQGPGPSRGTRLGLISAGLPPLMGSSCTNIPRIQSQLCLGQPRPQPQHSWPPPPQAWDSCSGTLATGWGSNPNSAFPEVGNIGMAGAGGGVGWGEEEKGKGEQTLKGHLSSCPTCPSPSCSASCPSPNSAHTLSSRYQGPSSVLPNLSHQAVPLVSNAQEEVTGQSWEER